MNDSPMLFFDKPHVDHEIKVKPQKVLGPEIKEFDRQCAKFVKSFVLSGASLVRLSGIGKTREREPRAHRNVRPKNVHGFQQATTGMRAQHGSTFRMVINGTKDRHESEECVFVHETARQDRLVGIVAGIVQFGQYFEGKVSRPTLDDA